METVHLQAHTDGDAQVTLRLPESMKDRDIEVTVVANGPNPWDGVPRDELGWPIGFWERFAGAYPDAPEEPEELPLDEPRL